MPKQPYINTFEDPALKKATLTEVRNAAPANTGVRPVKSTSTTIGSTTTNTRALKSTSPLEAAVTCAVVGSGVTSVERIIKLNNDNTIIVETDKEVVINTYEEVTEQKYINNNTICAGGSLQVGSITGSTFSLVNNATQLGFDTDSGFEVTDLGSGLAKIGMNSTFKCWEVDGNPGLIACGLDTVNFVAGSGVTITSCNTAVPKTLTISATGGSGGVSSLNTLTGALILSGGTNVTIGNSGSTLTICSSQPPAGSPGQVQFNNGGALAGAACLTYDDATCSVGMTKINVPTGQSLQINLSSTLSPSWYSLYGDLGVNVTDDYSSQTVFDSLGNIYIVGADGNNGVPYLVKFDGSGNILWQKKFTDTNNYYKTGDAVAVDAANNVYCIVGTDDAVNLSSVFKFDSNGTLIWSKDITDASQYFMMTDIVIDSTFNVIVGGFYQTNSAYPSNTTLLIKLDSSGNALWQKMLGNGSAGNGGYIQGVTVDSSDNIYIAAESIEGTGPRINLLLAKYDASGAVVWQKIYPNTFAGNLNLGQITIDSTGNLYVVGSRVVSQPGDVFNSFVIKTDNTGTILWQTNFENINTLMIGLNGVSLDSSGNVYVSGGNTYNATGPIGAKDLFFAKLNSTGSVLWQRFFGAAGNEDQYYYWACKTIDVYSSSFVATAFTSSAGGGNYEAITVKLPTDGSLMGSYTYFKYVEGSLTTNTTQLVASVSTYSELNSNNLFSASSLSASSATNSNNLFLMANGNNTYTFNSDGSFETPGFKLAPTTGVANTVLLNDGNNAYWGNIPNVSLDENGSFVVREETAATLDGFNSIVIGSGAVGNKSYACDTIALGADTLKCSIVGFNIAIGNCALRDNFFGIENIAIGAYGLQCNTNGNYNISLGRCSLANNITGQVNVAIGSGALRNNTYGASNVAIGLNSLCSNSGASNDNIVMGNSAMPFHVHGSGNTALGTETLRNNVTGANNFAAGYHALFCNVTGCDNIAIGYDAQATNIGGYENISIGSRSLYSNTTGIRNIAIGTYPMYRNTGGMDNIAMGIAVLENNTIGSYNIGLGHAALQNSTTASFLTAIGESALRENTTGSCNIAIGSNALRYNTTGWRNIAIGNSSAQANTFGGENTAIGYVALSGNTTGCRNFAIGSHALYGMNGGNDNVAIGIGALRNSSNSGSFNVAIGIHAGCCNRGSRNTFIGNTAGSSVLTGSNNTVIGNLYGSAGLICTVLIGAGTCERIKVDNNGLCINGAAYSPTVNLDAYCSFKVGNGLASSTGLNNFAVGPGALYCNTFGNNNFAHGFNAAGLNLTGCNNVAIGCEAFYYNCSGSNNIALGCRALLFNRSGYGNMALGRIAMLSNCTGNSNFAAGTAALYGNKTGSHNIAIGDSSSRCNQSGSYNISLGTSSNQYGCGNHNIAFGYNTLRGNSTGGGNIAMGCCSMAGSSGGVHNIAMGCLSLPSNTTDNNIAIGSRAGNSNTLGGNIVALGNRALYGNSTGNNNIGIGACAGCSITTGANNTVIGTLAGSAGLVCTVLIGAGTCERIKVDNSGLCINGVLISGGGSGTVTSVATSGSGLGFSLSGGPITTTGTVSLTVPSAADLSTCLQGDGLTSTSVGFRTLPQNSQSADYTLVAADSGKHILHPSSDANARTYTIPANGTVAYPIGTSITFINETTQVVTINITTDTMYLAGSGLTGSRTLSQYGVATAIKTGSTTWYISGTGLT